MKQPKYIDYLLYACDKCEAGVIQPCRDLPPGAVHVARAKSYLKEASK